MKIIHFIHHHWFVISMVYFPAFLGYLNAFAASCKVMGWTRFAKWLGKLEDALATFVSTVKGQQVATKAIILIIVVLSITGCISAKAKLSGTGINVQDSAHYIDIQANSFNSELDVNSTD